ncbi:hypothetical protein [Arthrobacter sp. UYCo732]|uniref:hypothetical protein n=1 Tax=Arthrobacter sp. UYCo732 TaxID=3156336 RepID=UPI00339A535C
MSEVLNDEVRSSEEAGFSRRRVVKGVAWSVPVIVAAVGAPPASASPGPVTQPSVTFSVPDAVTVTGATSASGPTGFDIQTGSAFVGTTVSYTISIDAVASKQKALLSVTSVDPVTSTPKSGVSGSGSKEVTTFSDILTTTSGNHKLHVAFKRFAFNISPGKGTHAYQVTLTATLDKSTTVTAVPANLTVVFP